MATLKPSRDFLLRRKEQVFAEGYEIKVAKELTPGLNTSDLVDDVFGRNDPYTETIVDTASLSMTVLELKDNNDLLDVLTGQSPAATGVKEYHTDDVEPISIWVNKKADDDTKYVRSFFYEDWTPQIPLSSGGPKERSIRTLTGLCIKPREFEGAWIAGEKIALTAHTANATYSGTISKTPVVDPRDSTLYAIRVLACSGTGSTMVTETVTLSSTVVTSAGVVQITNANLDNVKGPTAAYVNYLQTTTGIYPTNTTNIVEEGLYDAT